jgi:hypothetical protein
MSLGGLQTRSLKVRAADYDGTSKQNYVELQCIAGEGGAPYTITLPNAAPTQPNQVLAFDGSSYVWQPTSSGGFFYRGVTSDDLTDEHGNVLSVVKEIPLAPGDPGYDAALPFNGGTKVQTTLTNVLHNMSQFRAAKPGQIVAVNTESGDDSVSNVGVALAAPTELCFGDMSNGFVPSKAANASNWTTYADERNAQQQFQDTINLVTRREANNGNGLTPNDFAHMLVTPNVLSLKAQQGAGAEGEALGNLLQFSVDTSSAGAEVAKLMRNADELLSVDKDAFTVQNKDGITVGSSLVGNASGLTYQLAGNTQMSVAATDVYVQDSTAASKLNVNVANLKYTLGGNDQLVVNASSAAAMTGNGLDANEYKMQVSNGNGFKVLRGNGTTAEQRMVVGNTSFQLQTSDDGTVNTTMVGDTSGMKVKLNNNEQFVLNATSVTEMTGDGLAAGEYKMALAKDSGLVVSRGDGSAAQSRLEVGDAEFKVKTSDNGELNTTMVGNASGLDVKLANVSRMNVAENTVTLQKAANQSVLEVGASTLKYKVDATTFVTQGSTPDQLVSFAKNAFMMASTSTASADDWDVSDQSVVVKTGVDKASSNLQFKIELKDGSQASNKVRTVMFNRTPFSSAQNADRNLDSDSMKCALGLPQLELLSDNGQHRVRLYVHDNGKLYVQKYSSTEAKWAPCDMVLDYVN